MKDLHNITETKELAQERSYYHHVKLRVVLRNKGTPYFKVESMLGPSRVTFEVLRARLVIQVKLRINSGEFTERGLSRILGISQSQTHNVLKGARRLHMQLADRILAKLGLSAIDLLSEGELDGAIRLKMAEWDRQIEANVLEGFDLSELLAPKKPATRSGTNNEKEDQRTG